MRKFTVTYIIQKGREAAFKQIMAKNFPHWKKKMSRF